MEIMEGRLSVHHFPNMPRRVLKWHKFVTRKTDVKLKQVIQQEHLKSTRL